MWTIVNDEDRCRLLNELLARPSVVIGNGRVLKHDGTTTVVVAGDAERRWVVKRYNTKNRWHAVRRLVRVSRAANCWTAAWWLADAGVATPRPVAVMEERMLGFLRGRSYFVSEFIDGATLDHVLRHGGDDPSWLVEQAAEIVLRLRAAGIVHGDMKATNFVVSEGRMHLVDLDATRRASGRRLATGLRGDLERFLRNWHDRPGLLRQFEKQLGSA